MASLTLSEIKEKFSGFDNFSNPENFLTRLNNDLDDSHAMKIIDSATDSEPHQVFLTRQINGTEYHLLGPQEVQVGSEKELGWFFDWALQKLSVLEANHLSYQNSGKIEFLSDLHSILGQLSSEESPRLLVKKLADLFEERFGLKVEGVWMFKDQETVSLYEPPQLEPVQLPPRSKLESEEELIVYDEHHFYTLSDGRGKIGIIAFYAPTGKISDELKELFEPLIPVIASYLRRLEKWITTARHELYDFGQTQTLSKELFQTSQGMEEVWDTLVKTVYGMFECDDCRLFLKVSPRKLVLRGQYPSDEQKGTELLLGEDPLVQSVLDEQKAVLINNLPEQDDDERSAKGIRSFLAVPFRYQDEVMGTINLSSETPDVYTSEDLEKLTRFADNLATVYHNTEEFANLTSYVEKLLANLPVGVVDLRLKSEEVVLNEVAGKLLASKERVIKRHNFEDFLAEIKGGPQLLELIYEPRLDEATGPKKIELNSDDYYPRVVSAISTPLKNVESELTGVLLVLTDITEQQKLNRQINRQERLAALGELASSLAHEIKNPLTSIIGFTQLIPQRSGDTEFLEKMAEIVQREAERLNSLVENLLSFGKPQVGSRSLVKIKELIDDIHVLLRKRADKQGVEFVCNIPEGTVVYGDALKLKQIFLNLALNALDALSEGGKLEITAKMHGDTTVVEVIDDGPGMVENVISKIFNPFFTTRDEGTGLGLAISHRIVEEHDGEIRVNSTAGQGTTMQVFLPAGEENAESDAEEGEQI